MICSARALGRYDRPWASAGRRALDLKAGLIGGVANPSQINGRAVNRCRKATWSRWGRIRGKAALRSRIRRYGDRWRADAHCLDLPLDFMTGLTLGARIGAAFVMPTDQSANAGHQQARDAADG